MPSTPSVKLRFRLENQKNFMTNWKEPTDFWKKPQSSKEVKNDKPVEFKAIIFNNFSFLEGVNNNSKTPKIGNTKI